MTAEGIDQILLVGGSTRIPRVVEILTDFFAREPQYEINRCLAIIRFLLLFYYHGSKIFFKWAYPDQNHRDFVDYPSNKELKELEEDYPQNISAINRLKSKYSSTYETFRDEWMKLDKKFKKPFNAEQPSLFDDQLDTGKGSDYKQLATGQIINKSKVGRNDPCPCVVRNIKNDVFEPCK